MSDWRTELTKEWKRRMAETPASNQLFPLIAQSFDETEIIAMVDTLLTGRLTMASRVREFEQQFAKYVGAKYAVMVNSGSSANLLAMAVMANPARKRHLKAGPNSDEVLVPAVCWSTSAWPIIQMGLKPVFVDVDPNTLNVDLELVKRKLTPRVKGMVAVHILGNSAPMDELMKLARAHDLIVMEDTCESLGSTANGPSGTKFLGTFAEFGTYSFYYSHHLTTGEGGMVVCDSLEDYDLLKCLRAHGWSREFSNKAELEAKHTEVDPRFLFVNIGYNLRPMEIQASMGSHQLPRLAEMNKTRNQNRDRLEKALTSHAKWKGQFLFPKAAPGTNAAWFGFPVIMKPEIAKHRTEYVNYLTANGVENRPIISGNFVRQPALKLFGVPAQPKDFPGAELLNEQGFFIGLHTTPLPDEMIRKLADIMLGYRFS